jgi:hypothetical protein
MKSPKRAGKSRTPGAALGTLLLKRLTRAPGKGASRRTRRTPSAKPSFRFSPKFRKPAKPTLPVVLAASPPPPPVRSVTPVATQSQVVLVPAPSPLADSTVLRATELIRPNDRLKQSIEGFLLDQRSPHTRRAYGKDLKRFMQFLLGRRAQTGIERIGHTAELLSLVGRRRRDRKKPCRRRAFS